MALYVGALAAPVAVLGLGLGLYLMKRYFSGGVCRSKALLTGKTAIVTGANTGIGLETAVDLARRGARVILACRSVERGEKAAVLVRQRSGNEDVAFVQLDLSSQDSIRVFGEKILKEERHIDILINNAGVFHFSFRKTQDGIQSVFAVNHLGPFLLTLLLLERIKESQPARIVNVSSSAAFSGKIDFDTLSPESFRTWPCYCQSKLALVMFSQSLAKKLEGTSVLVNAVHPGLARTEIGRDYPKLSFVFWPLAYMFSKSCWEGSQTTIHCAVCEEVNEISGQFFVDCKVKRFDVAQAKDEELADRLWRVSAQMVGWEEEEEE